ncbi:MAG: hypothetical protein JO328_11085 [Hyphomicrobiales bacterium]|nr:hypothetical protein [Hyphomicrobiales bacterium]MBV8827139.1 hypothetical protein [Hyphomicrobiales bacterium]MBV9426740.1 hypothetical protein [Bradyrhizobiaceae bacterium]
MRYSETDERAFYRRQATRLLELADGCENRPTAKELLKAAEYYIGKLEQPPGPAIAA